MAKTWLIYNHSTGQQFALKIDPSGSYDGSGAIVWDERIDGAVINDLGNPISDSTIMQQVGKWERRTSPSLHLYQLASVIPAHQSAYESSLIGQYVDTWAVKMKLQDILQLTAVNTAVAATYSEFPRNQIAWEQKYKHVIGGVISDIIQTELGYTWSQMVTFYESAISLANNDEY